MHYAIVCATAGRASAFSASRRLARASLIESLDGLLSTAAYLVEALNRVTAKWDDVYPGVLLSWSSAVNDAVARAGAT